MHDRSIQGAYLVFTVKNIQEVHDEFLTGYTLTVIPYLY